ncbi:MAG: phosphatidylglycerol lysyltransferase domain-containing protein [Candidatus Margulisiibacteriota bacterium]
MIQTPLFADALIAEHGHNPMAYQLMLPEFEHWFSRQTPGLMGYKKKSGALVVAGPPVCAIGDIPDLVDGFSKTTNSPWLAFGLLAPAAKVFEQLNWRTLAVAAQPFWKPSDWATVLAAKPSLPKLIRRAVNKQVVCQEITQTLSLWENALAGCRRHWLAHFKSPPLQFFAQSDVLEQAGQRRSFVATIGGKVVAYAMVSPITPRNGWFLEQLVRDPKAPVGTIECLIDHVMQTANRDQLSVVFMGMVPFSAFTHTRSNPKWINGLFRVIKRSGQRLYSFNGLDAFRAKLRPTGWETLYVAFPKTVSVWRVFWGVGLAFLG